MKTLLLLLLFSVHLSSIRAESSILEQDEQYQKNNKELTLILKASQDVGANECKTDKGELPRSANLWFTEGKRLLEGENRKFNLFNAEIARVQKKIASTSGETLQAESLLILSQLHSLEIDYLNGRNGRIQLKKEFLVEFKNTKISAKYEDTQWLDAYKAFVEEGLNRSLEIAKDACEEKVKGCEEAQSQIQLFIAQANAYKANYLRKKIPSKTANDDLRNKEIILLASIGGMVNPSDNKYDWKAPALSGITKMIEKRKAVSISCSESKDSKSQKKAVEIAKIYEDKTKSDEVKNEEMKKVDESLANAVIGGSLKVSDLKLIPEEWNRQNLMMAQGHDREPFFAEVEKMVESLIAADQAKLALIQEKKGKVLKMIMALGDLTKHKIDLASECGTDPTPGITICPSMTPNPLCDPNSVESARANEYRSCFNSVNSFNDQLTQLAKASDELKNNPNVVAVEATYLGTVGPIWRAKIKNADGTFSYKNIIEAASQYGTDGFGAYAGFAGVQNDPKNAAVVGPTSSTSSSTPSKTKVTPAAPKTQTKTIGTAGITEEADIKKKSGTTEISKYNAEEKKIYSKYAEKITKEDERNRVKIAVYCGENPCKGAQSKACTLDDAEVPKLKEYNICASAVNEHNYKLDASINLSSYVRTHADFVEIARSPETNLWMAKMQNTIKGVYYLPLNYTGN